MQEMILKIPGVPPLLLKPTPEKYADTPFALHIAMVEIPIRCAVPAMKLYDGSDGAHKPIRTKDDDGTHPKRNEESLFMRKI